MPDGNWPEVVTTVDELGTGWPSLSTTEVVWYWNWSATGSPFTSVCTVSVPPHSDRATACSA